MCMGVTVFLFMMHLRLGHGRNQGAKCSSIVDHPLIVDSIYFYSLQFILMQLTINVKTESTKTELMCHCPTLW